MAFISSISALTPLMRNLAGAGDSHSFQCDGGTVQDDWSKVGMVLYSIEGDVFGIIPDAGKNKSVISGSSVLEDEFSFWTCGHTGDKSRVDGL